MKLNRPYILYICICLWLLFLPSCTNRLWGKDFVVVIDAGHGGHDPGAIGKISKEKNINLNVALKVGNLIKKNCDDVKLIYTRSKDVFIPLARRAEIANNAKADLFISIHTNALANNRTAKGASTWTLGLAKSEANLEVAKRENAVILYESDYETRRFPNGNRIRVVTILKIVWVLAICAAGFAVISHIQSTNGKIWIKQKNSMVPIILKDK